MLFKTLSGSVKDVDTSGRKVCGFGSGFGNKDRHGDIIPLGAYKKTITERGPGATEEIYFLDQHRVDRRVNRFKASDKGVLEEKEEGLYFEIFFPPTELGNDLLKQYEFEVIRDHSVGIDIVDWEYREDLEAFILTELILWEISAVTWGANNQTPAVGIKGLDDPADIALEIGRLRKCIDGGVTDHTARELTLGVRILEARAGALSAAEKAIGERRKFNELLRGGEGGLVNEKRLREAVQKARRSILELEDLIQAPATDTEEGTDPDPLLEELRSFNAEFSKV